MKLVAEIVIPGLPWTINRIGRAHWTVKVNEARLWKSNVFAACLDEGIHDINLPKATLELTRYSSREPDFDNLASSFKHVLDGLVKARVIPDDKPSVIGSPIFKWVKEPKKSKARISIKIFIEDSVAP